MALRLIFILPEGTVSPQALVVYENGKKCKLLTIIMDMLVALLAEYIGDFILFFHIIVLIKAALCRKISPLAN